MLKLNKQNGIVLIISLTFLIILTTLASRLMSNTIIDIKIVRATQEKSHAIEEAINIIDEIIAQQSIASNENRYFRQSKNNYPFSINTNNPNIQVNVSLASSQSYNVNCPHATFPSSIKNIKCHHFLIKVNSQYGRYNHQNIIVKAGLLQQVFDESD